ncbi:MAG: DUF2087 domain-containing protein [Anaerolineales bacterium]|nr:DUF2087 domain-containing protein [Anaerolineales bacterium]
MKANRLMNKEEFIKRLATLCLKSGLSDLPKDLRDQHILLKSIELTLEPSGTFTEKEINEQIKKWVDDVSQIKGLDQATLRRRLIDTGYLKRSKDGTTYQLTPGSSQKEYFDESVDQLDIPMEIEKAREEIETRKRDYLRREK